MSPRPSTLALILAGGRGERLGPLTVHRAKPAVHFGGTYRIVDFAVSNCINSGLNRILVPIQYRSRSLNTHIRDGLSRYFNSARGEFIEPLPPQQREGEHWYTGTADAVYQNLFAVREEEPELVLILAGDHIYKMDYRHMIDFHLAQGAEATCGAVEVPRGEASSFGVLAVDEADRIIEFQEKPKEPKAVPGDPETCLASMGIYVFRARTLYELLEHDAEDPDSSHDFGRDIVPKMLGARPLYAFRFVDENKKERKYWRDVGTIDAFYEANLDLVSVDPQLNLYDPAWPIYTRLNPLPPPKFVFEDEGDDGRVGAATDSLVSPGCIVSGGRVRRSVLSPGCRINSYALVEDSVLFDNVYIGRRAKVRRAIIDKDVRIPEGATVGFDLEEDRKRFTVTAGGVVVIPKGAVL
ncbi:MAG: glucose-1-phosphate adenylyltransferase [Elusimicrobia bacterium]|nr:glucose-1-phosphate adenylyltransferase [Elusimicrobiota bacterium]